jgi:hypothetical protein
MEDITLAEDFVKNKFIMQVYGGLLILLGIIEVRRTHLLIESL